MGYNEPNRGVIYGHAKKEEEEHERQRKNYVYVR